VKATSLQTCRISLLTVFLAAMFPEAGLAGTAGINLSGEGFGYMFQLSSTPLESSRGG
jgi:hypothetical protein